MRQSCINSARRTLRLQCGAALNEFAIVLMVLLLFTMGFADLSQVFVNRSKIDLIVRELGRKAALLERDDCFAVGKSEIENALALEGFSHPSVTVGGGFIDPLLTPKPLGVHEIYFVINVNKGLVTEVLSLVGIGSALPSERTYSFPVEYPGICRDPTGP